MHSSVLDELIISFNKVKECSNDANLKAYESNFIAANQAIQDLETQIQFVRLKMYLYQREFSKAHAIARSLKKTPSNIKKSIPVIQSLIEEEKYFDVIEICNIFQPIRLDQDSVTTEEEYNQFVELRQKAIDKLKEYNRFDITRLPYEIRIFILKQLDFIDIVNCINVSKDWRRCICNDSANNKYHVILDSKTRQQSGSFSSNFFKTSMKLLCDSVKNLKLDRRLLGEDTRMEIRDLLKSVRFNNLRVLKIDIIIRNYSLTHFLEEEIGYTNDFSRKQLTRLLRNSCHSLEEVYFTQSAITCSEILNICPNLHRLRCEIFDALSQEVSQPQYLPLTYLYIDITDESQIKDFEQVLKRLINLEELTISSQSISMATVHLIQQYGSRQLRHICIDTAQQFDENIYATRNCYQTYIDTSCYDYTIDVHNWGSKATASLLLQLINHSIDMKQKIKALSLSLAHCSQVDDWNAFKYFTAPCLQYLRFSFTEQTEEIFASVIRNCPTIQDISIFRLLSPPTDIIIDALITLPLLQCFAIENIKNEVFEDEHYSFDYYYDYDFFPISYSDINSVPIQRFFQYHVSLDNQSTLQEVRLRHIQNLDPSAFYTLYKIKSLKSLNFAGPDVLYGIRHYQGGSNAVGWATVITDKQECLLPDQIEDLVLEDSKAISDSDLEFLDIPSITIGELSALKITAIQKMMTNAQKLKKLTVFDYGEFQEDGEILEDTAKRNNISLEIVMRN